MVFTRIFPTCSTQGDILYPSHLVFIHPTLMYFEMTLFFEVMGWSLHSLQLLAAFKEICDPRPGPPRPSSRRTSCWKGRRCAHLEPLNRNPLCDPFGFLTFMLAVKTPVNQPEPAFGLECAQRDRRHPSLIRIKMIMTLRIRLDAIGWLARSTS